jgi:hypothetical protein
MTMMTMFVPSVFLSITYTDVHSYNNYQLYLYVFQSLARCVNKNNN